MKEISGKHGKIEIPKEIYRIISPDRDFGLGIFVKALNGSKFTKQIFRAAELTTKIYNLGKWPPKLKEPMNKKGWSNQKEDFLYQCAFFLFEAGRGRIAHISTKGLTKGLVVCDSEADQDDGLKYIKEAEKALEL